MPVNEQLKLGFIHIPKTAGTTVEKALGMQQENRFYSTKQLPDLHVCPQHMYYSELSNLIYPGDYTWFTVVRNPFDRLVSEFHYMKQYAAGNPNYHGYSFDDLIRFCLPMDEEHRKISFDRHLEPQVNFIAGASNMRIFRYENLPEMFEWLKEFTGQDLQFGHHMKSSHAPNYRTYYNDSKLIDMVRMHYADDLKTFNYDF